MSNFNLVFIEQQEAELRDQLFASKGVEGAAYVLMRECNIGDDPWDRRSRTKLVVHEIVHVPVEDRVSSSSTHVTWSTKGFVALLQRCQREKLVLGIAHCHPFGPRDFSKQDDGNEEELFRTACNRNGPATKLVSILFYDDGGIRARVWQFPRHRVDCKAVAVFGERFRFHFPASPSPISEVFARQVLAFGPSLTAQLKALRIGIIGAGGTGSATAMLAARAGAGHIVVVDDDIVEATNLNRLHGATQSDADAMVGKAEIAAREIARMGLGARVVAIKGWANSLYVRDALKSCDVIFCCTDDNAGRVFLNRLAYFYFIPIIDMGLAMALAKPPAVGMADISARVTTVLPPETCLLCRDAVDIERAREEDLRRRNPSEYDRQKREAYVIGEGNPNPAVVTFTTEVACMAVDELLNRIVGYRKREMGSEHRRRFLFCEDRSTAAAPRNTCAICASKLFWGMADAEPFLDLVG